MGIVDSIIEKIRHIIQSSRSAAIYTGQCNCIIKALQELCEKISKISENKYSDNLNQLLISLNVLLPIIDKFEEDESIQYCLQTPVFQTIIKILRIMLSINHILQEVNIQLSNQYELSSQSIIQDIKNLHTLLSKKTQQNDPKIKERITEIKQLSSNISKLDEYKFIDVSKDNIQYTIFKGQKRSNKENVDIMIFKEQLNASQIFDDISAFKKIKHPFIESFENIIYEPTYIIITRCAGEELSTIISRQKLLVENNQNKKENQQISLQPGSKTIIAAKIAYAMAYLHSIYILHGDLCSSNILLKDSFNPQIINFSNSEFFPQITETAPLHAFTLNTFKAPELYANEVSSDEAIDVFSFGGILYELLTSTKPFEGCPDIDQKIINRTSRLEFPNETPSKLKYLIEVCCSHEPADRPSFADIIFFILENKLTFPGDEDVDIVEKFYSDNSIKEDEIKYCVELSNQISNLLDDIAAFKYQYIHIRSLVHSYQYFLITSKYALEEIENTDSITLLINLKNSFNFLLLNLQLLCSEKFRDTYLSINYEEFAVSLYEGMNNIYVAMTNLDLNVDKYDYDPEEVKRDFRNAFNFIKDNNEIEIDENKEYSEEEINQMTEISMVRMAQINNFLRLNGFSAQIPHEEINERISIIFNQYNDFYVERNDFEIIKKDESDGVSAFVHRAIQKSTGKFVAIKEFRDSFVNEQTLKYLKREIIFLLTLKNKYLIPFIGFNNDSDQPLWVISLYIEGGELFDAKCKLTGIEKTKIAFEIAEGMEYLHSKNVIHRDLKTSNILLDHRDLHKDLKTCQNFPDDLVTPLIADFGYARTDINTIMSRSIGTYNYMAPEVIQSSIYDFKADVFSFAMILWELYSGVYPFHSCHDDLKVQNKILNGAPLPFSKPISPNLRDLIDLGRKTPSSERPAFTEIINKMLEEEIVYPGTTDAEKALFYAKKREQRNAKK